MTKEYQNAIINYTKKKFGRDDLDLSVHVAKGEKPFLILTVDCEKMDKNSGKFDQSYFDFVTEANKPKPKGFFLDFGSNVLSSVVRYFKKFMDIEIGTWFSHKNCDYLDNIEKLINEGIKMSSEPEIEVEFVGRGENPKVTLGFYNCTTKIMDNWENFNIFVKEIEEITNIDLSQYSHSKTMGEKK